MKPSTVLKPAMLFAAGSVVSTAASAAPTIMDVNYQATSDGTQITLAGSSTAQYNFQARPKEIFGTGFHLDGLDGAQVTGTSSGTPFYPSSDDAALGDSVKTGKDLSISTLAAADRYYGLRFASNGRDYTGFAGVNTTGDVITQIGFQQVAGVPEPSTWTLMIAGFGGVGLAMRRRRRQPASAAIA